ncbi:hypothetical protein BH20VER1_BH20VER1_04910 [soil metagenome]
MCLVFGDPPMKTKNVRRSASVLFRVLIASLLCLAAGMLTLLAFVPAAQQLHNNRHATWLTRLASTLGIEPSHGSGTPSTGADKANGGAVKIDKEPAEGTQPLMPAAVPFSGRPVDRAPVRAVRSGKLRDMRPIDPATVQKNDHPSPILPTVEQKSGGPDGTVQRTAGPVSSAPTPTGLSFDGVGVGLLDYRPGSNPPDVNGNVGATQYVQWNNTSFAIFDKNTGALQYGPAAGNTLFQELGGVCATFNNGDPVVTYDILAGRWVLSQFVVAASPTSYSHQCFAVSVTSDATGEYYLYDFETDPVNFVDYPHQATWPDGYYMAAHIFGAGLAFIEGRVYVFEREKMIYGLPARMQFISLGPNQIGHLPADLEGLTPPPPGAPAFVLGPNRFLTNLTNSYRVKVTWDPLPTIVVTAGEILGGIASPPCLSGTTAQGRDCVPQPPPAVLTDYLDRLSQRYMHRLVYRNQGTQAAPDESLVVSAVSTSLAGNLPAHGAVEWFEFRHDGNPTTQPTLFQNSTYDPDTHWRWMPSITMDRSRNIALGYSKSSTTVKPGIYVTGRQAGDPINTMGAEVEMKAGIGSQLGAGNRWGDYTSMNLDPIDQCTFYYTNEYLKTNGSFNWSTRIASFRFPSCQSAAGLYGTVTGTIVSAEDGVPIPGVTVTLSNGYAGAADANGVYTILVPAGTYTATAAHLDRNCTSASPASATVAPAGGATVVQNFVMTGISKLEANGVTLDDSVGNNNGIVNRNECVLLNLGVKNNGCAKETAVSARLTTSTPGVTVVDRDSSYPDLPIDAVGTNATPFKIFVSNEFGCGTDIQLSLELTYAGGTKTVQYKIPTCAGGPNQFIPLSQLTTTDATQADRVGRNQVPSTCSGKAPPGGGFPGTKYYETYTFTNTAGAPRCYTVTINAQLGGPGDIQSVAYDQAYNPTNLNENYLGDSGISGLGTTVDTATYSFTVPALHNFIVVVNTTGTTESSPFSGVVSGFIDNTPGPGACTAAPAGPVLTSAATRLTHAAAGTFDVPMSLTGGSVEPRHGNGNYTAVLRFNTPVQSGNASVTSGTGTAGAPVFSGNDMLVPLSGVADEQRLTLTATNVTAADGGVLSSVSVQMGFLIGDTNGNGTVNASDVSETKSQSGMAVTGSNFRQDVTVNGAINSSDVSLVKSRSGAALPANR